MGRAATLQRWQAALGALRCAAPSGLCRASSCPLKYMFELLGTAPMGCPALLDSAPVGCPGLLNTAHVGCPVLLYTAPVGCPVLLDTAPAGCPWLLYTAPGECPGLLDTALGRCLVLLDSARVGYPGLLDTALGGCPVLLDTAHAGCTSPAGMYFLWRVGTCALSFGARHTCHEACIHGHQEGASGAAWRLGPCRKHMNESRCMRFRCVFLRVQAWGTCQTPLATRLCLAGSHSRRRSGSSSSSRGR